MQIKFRKDNWYLMLEIKANQMLSFAMKSAKLLIQAPGFSLQARFRQKIDE